MVISKDRQYQIIPAHIGLRKYVQYFNICFPDKDSFNAAYTLMPNACGTISLSFDGKGAKAEIWGAPLNSYILGAEPNEYKVLVLIKLTHVGLFQLTKQNQTEFVDKRIDLQEVDPILYWEIMDAFISSDSVDEMIGNFEKSMYQRMEWNAVSNALLNATSIIYRNHGLMKVGEVVATAGYSERQTNRLFQSQIGMSTKQYLGLTRFNYLLKNIQLSPSPFASLSQKAGYYDQAHMDKDFKKISGISPLEYRRNMSDFYYDGSEKADMILYKTKGGFGNGN